MKKSRFFYLHPECNQGKIEALDSLHTEYVTYVRICIECLLTAHLLTLPRSEKQGFFPRAEKLTSQIEKNARDHAIQIVSTWAKSVYARTLKSHIKQLFKRGEISEDTRRQLCIIGKCLVCKSSKNISQEALDLYWTFLSDVDLVGKFPTASDRIPIRMSENTCSLQDPEEAAHADFWINISTLVSRHTIWLPLIGNPYIKKAFSVSKGIHARKDRRGRWRFEAVEKQEWEIPEAAEEMPRIGIDVGLNVVAATSDGRTFGADLKPKFNELYSKVQKVRANRQRQNLKENSPRLDRLESKLSGMTRSITGRVSNELIEAYPDHVFVLEDLNLSGLKGQKRFCYRALVHFLEFKAATETENPAYTSQLCPSCGHVHRLNRKGTDFVCRQCGRQSHADIVGGINLLGRSEAKRFGPVSQRITLDHHYTEVKEVLVKLYWDRRNPNQDCPQDFLDRYAPVPSGRKLTTRVSLKREAGTASNQVPDQLRSGS